MRFGISFLPDADPSTKDACAYFRDALALSALADEGGLHFVKMTEHYLQPYGGYCPSPLSFLSAVATRTQHIRLLTGGILPVFHHPLQIASQAAMLDAISGGRAEIGFARAYMPYEFDAFGVPMDGSRERFVETVNAVMRLWREEEVTLETKFFSFRNARMLPRCTQSPHPPVWVAAAGSPQSFEWIGQQGFKLLVNAGMGGNETLSKLISTYRQAFAAAHGNRDVLPEVGISLPLFIRDEDQSAFVEGDPFLQHYLDVWARAAKAWDRTRSTDYPGYTYMSYALRNDSAKAMRERRAAIVGSPVHVIEQIQQLRSELGIDTILWQIDFGAMPGKEAQRTLELFIEKVLPDCP
jgi:alkanesulfonate monooxygenase SsuD/methylene tetrahydromethanopterin reductase-like flavin-dependent oxidoreductase (luciferase family)